MSDGWASDGCGYPPGPWEAFLQRYAESCGETMDRDTTEQVFGCVRRRGREGRQDEGEVGPAKRRRLEAEGEGPPVVMLTGISQSIAKKLKTVRAEIQPAALHAHHSLSLSLLSMSPSSPSPSSSSSVCRSSRVWGEQSLTGRGSALTLWLHEYVFSTSLYVCILCIYMCVCAGCTDSQVPERDLSVSLHGDPGVGGAVREGGGASKRRGVHPS